jgi:hypothetical protein
MNVKTSEKIDHFVATSFTEAIDYWVDDLLSYKNDWLLRELLRQYRKRNNKLAKQRRARTGRK